MDIKEILNKIKNIEKEKLLLLTLAGILLIGASCFEGGSTNKDTGKTTDITLESETGYQSQMEQKVKNLVGKINGISDVTVLITLKTENEKVIQEEYPNVEGVAIVAKGVSESGHKEEIINMLSSLFNVPVHKISVLETD